MAIQLNFSTQKKKILILVSRGGGGHQAASNALEQILSPEYEVEVNSVIDDILGSMDPLKRLTRNYFTGEDLYNFFLRRPQLFLKWMVFCGPYYLKSQRIEKQFEKFLKTQSEIPDLIISPTPYINYGISCVAHRWEIPFLIIPTDLDASTFLAGFPQNFNHHRLRFALPYDDPEIKKITFDRVVLNDHQCVVTGFPVRPNCQQKYGVEELSFIRSKFHLLQFYKTITLIMGAIGGNALLDHVKTLIGLDPRHYQIQLQINVCVGYNRKMQSQIAHLLLQKKARSLQDHSFLLPNGLVIHIREYMKEIIELMAASDLIITKTGSCTVNEAIYLGKKLLLDYTEKSTARYLAWEEFNIPFIQKHGMGYAFTDSKQLLMLLPSLLKYPETNEVTFHLPNFTEIIQSTIREMTS